MPSTQAQSSPSNDVPPTPTLHLETALSQVTDGVITTDRAGIVTFMNSTAETLTGKSRPAATGMLLASVFSIVDSITGAAIEAAVNDAKRAELPEAAMRNAVLLGSAERPIIIEYRVAAIRNERGVVCGTVTVFRDVTPRRAAELALQTTEETLLANAEALFEEKERARVTLHSIGDGVISTDFRGRVSFLNNVAERITGWTQTEAAGRPLDKTFLLVDATTREYVNPPAMEAIIENRTVRVESDCVLIRRDGQESAVEVSASPIHDQHDGVVGAVVVAHDVTEARDLSAKLARLALHDNLTGLPNRVLLADRLEKALERAQRNGSAVSLLFVDLDRFKPVNDSLGHVVGDRLLQQVATRLQGCVRSSDTVCRYGGDEFIVMLPDIAHPHDAAICADKILASLSAPFSIGEHELNISASVGIAGSQSGATDSTTLMQQADAAMYQVKAEGRKGFRFFSPAAPHQPG
jgi:diguanylate cyclase (GGDEF)-like protein/PAS domain S-box-containing protein